MNTFFRIRMTYLPRPFSEPRERVFGVYDSQSDAFRIAFDSMDMLIESFRYEMKCLRHQYLKTVMIEVDEFVLEGEEPTPVVIRSWGEKLRY
jgi:hypothetical protein